MQICGAPIPPDCQYILDSAVDLGELDGLSHVALNLLGERLQIMQLIDEPAPCYSDRRLAARQDMCYRLSEYARTVVGALDTPHQRAFVAKSLIAERHRSHELAEILASWNYEDSTVGGALQPFRRGAVRLRRDGTPTPRVLRRLRSPEAIRRYVRGDPAASVQHHARLAHGIAALPWPDHPSEARLLDPLFEAQEGARNRRRERAMQEFVNRHGAVGKSRKKIGSHRKLLARSATTSARLLGDAPTRAFLRGEAVSIPTAGDLIFQVRSERTSALGPGAVRVSLAATRGERLANLCLYFDDTPPLDQLVAIALHAEAGNAEELLSAGNLFDLTEAGAAHPALRDRARSPGLDDHPFFRQRLFNYDRARQDRMVRDYHRDYGQHYRRALEDAVWADRAPRLRRFWALMR